ncbi:hypothetical protein BYT27DRAFT_7270648 [Phlegmacium glaucopus]|nr:hypothetical protein BYT27DRAFT_7270648 [Phlegmacium glaucopus]
MWWVKEKLKRGPDEHLKLVWACLNVVGEREVEGPRRALAAHLGLFECSWWKRGQGGAQMSSCSSSGPRAMFLVKERSKRSPDEHLKLIWAHFNSVDEREVKEEPRRALEARLGSFEHGGRKRGQSSAQTSAGNRICPKWLWPKWLKRLGAAQSSPI